MASNPYVNKVIYGGNTLIDISDTTATASDVASGKYFYAADGTKTLGTSSGGSVSIIDAPDSHGGTVRTITSNVGLSYAWYATNAELVDSARHVVKLSDTGYATWTPSTTQTSIWSSPKTIATDFTQYTYVYVQKFCFDPVYQDGTTLLAAPTRGVMVYRHEYYVTPSTTLSDWDNNIKGTKTVGTTNQGRLFYVSTAGVPMVNSSLSNGIYTTSASTSFSSSNVIITQAIYARCNANYFSTDMAEALDQDKSTFTLVQEWYRVPLQCVTMYQAIIDELMGMYHNGL